MNNSLIHFKSISEFHRAVGLPKPEYPLISVINIGELKQPLAIGTFSRVFDFYSISLKKNFHLKMKYGQQEHDFDEGVLHFMAPGQVLTVNIEPGQKHNPSGWIIFVHPDMFWNTPLAKNIKQYEYFGYSVNEALHLSEKEETILTNIATNITQEYHANIDKFSQPVIVAQLELLLTYADRFYQRQFITRKISSHALLDKLEDFLSNYFQSGSLATRGLPSVTYIAESLNVSPNYLSGLLKTLTGQSTQQHLHNKLIELAKEKLSTTRLSVSEIAYQLGFEHLASFSKLFKTKTNQSPLEFRASFN